MRLLTLIVMLLLVLGLKAQSYTINPFQGGYFDPHPSIGGNMIFNMDDFLISLQAGLSDTGFDYYIGAEFGTRPGRKQILVEDEDVNNLYYQYHENISFIGLNLDKKFYFLGISEKNKLGVYAGMRAGFMWGNYRGLSNYGKNRWYLSPDLGAIYTHNNLSFKLGYTVLDIPSIESSNFINFEISYILNRHNKDD